jgi:hypothetical protein
MKLVARVVALSLAVLLAAELGARLFLSMDALVYRDSDDPTLAFELRPGAHGIKNGVPVEISEQGLRDEIVPSEKAPGERRVVVVGGHETFGIGVEAKDTFVRELAEGLVVPREGRARTVNLSMYSYRLGQKVELACRKLPGLAPDLVVLQVSEGDGSDLPPPLVRSPRLKNWIREHSVLVRWASEKLYLSKRPAAASSSSSSQTRVQLRRFKECVDAMGARAVVMVLPNLAAPRANSPSALRLELQAGAKELGLQWVDIDAELEALPPQDRLVFPGQPFLSPKAHRVLADALRRRLKPLLKKRRVPAPAPSRPSV